VVEDVADLPCVEPGIDRDEHPARAQHGEMGGQKHRHVGCQEGHPVSGLHTRPLQSAREPTDLLGKARVAPALVAVDHCDLFRKHTERPLQQRERGHGVEMNGSLGHAGDDTGR
jgi:hypothetical protein